MQNQQEEFRRLVEHENWIGFNWATAELAGVSYPQAAMMISFEDATTREKLQFQFDTGAPRNLLYDKAQQQRTRSKAAPQVENGETRKLLDVQFDGNCPRVQVVLSSKENFDPNDAQPGSQPLIGTLGLEFLGDTGFAIDYPARRIYLLSSSSLDRLEERHSTHFHSYLSSFHNLPNKIVLPFSMEGRQDVAIFDTGTSMFEMTFPQERWESLAHATFDDADETIQVPAWGKYLTIYRKNVRLHTSIGGKHLPVSEIYSSSSPQAARLSIIGNKLFFDHALIFDKRKMLFAIF